MMEWLSVNMPDLTTTAIATVGGCLLAGVSKLSSWFYTKRVKPRLEQLDRVDKIVYEVTYNGGGSLKDAVRDISKKRDADRDLLLEIRSDIHEIKNRNANRIYIDSQPIFECDENGNCFRVNRKWCELTGYSHDEATGNGWMGLIATQQNAERICDKWERAVHSFEKFDEVFDIRHASTKKLIKVRCVALVQRNKQREIEYILGTFEAIS